MIIWYSRRFQNDYVQIWYPPPNQLIWHMLTKQQTLLIKHLLWTVGMCKMGLIKSRLTSLKNMVTYVLWNANYIPSCFLYNGHILSFHKHHVDKKAVSQQPVKAESQKTHGKNTVLFRLRDNTVPTTQYIPNIHDNTNLQHWHFSNLAHKTLYGNFWNAKADTDIKEQRTIEYAITSQQAISQYNDPELKSIGALYDGRPQGKPWAGGTRAWWHVGKANTEKEWVNVMIWG